MIEPKVIKEYPVCGYPICKAEFTNFALADAFLDQVTWKNETAHLPELHFDKETGIWTVTWKEW